MVKGLVDPTGLTDTVTKAIEQASAKGYVAELELILDATGNQAARTAIDRLKSKAADVIAKECRGSINRVFPNELREKTLEEIIKLVSVASGAGGHMHQAKGGGASYASR